MADVNIIRDSDVLHYDPDVDGYPSTVWETVSGSPSVSSGDLAINNAEIVGVSGIKLGILDLVLNFPVDPTAGEDKEFGFQSPSNGNDARVEFVISGSTFKAVIYDDDGNNIIDREMIWKSAWSGSEVRFSVKLNQRGVYFVVDGDVRGKFTDIEVPEMSVVPHIKNGNSNDLDLSLMSIH